MNRFVANIMPPSHGHLRAVASSTSSSSTYGRRHLDTTSAPVALMMNQSGLYYAICFTLAFLGCYVATQLTEQLRIMKRQPSRVLGTGTTLLLLSLSLGGVAVWVMHLTSLATMTSTLPDGQRVPLSFGSGLTALSLLISALASIVGTYIASRDQFFYKTKTELGEIMKGDGQALTLREVRKSGTLVRNMLTKNMANIFLGGLVTGGGFCTMHYIGLLATVFPGTVQWVPGVVAASALIGWLGATVAFWILFRFLTLYPDKETYRIASAAVMAVAICGMHYVGCAGTKFIYTGVPQTTVTLEVSAGNTIAIAILVGLTFLWAVIIIIIGDLRAYFYSRVAIVNSLERLLTATAEACKASGRDNINIHVLIERYEQLKAKHQIRGQLSVDGKHSTGGRASSVNSRKQSVHQKLLDRLMGRVAPVSASGGDGRPGRGASPSPAQGLSRKSSEVRAGDPSTRQGHSVSPLASHHASAQSGKIPEVRRGHPNRHSGASPSLPASARQSVADPVSVRSANDDDALVDRVADANTRYLSSRARGGGPDTMAGGGPAPAPASMAADDVQYGEWGGTNIPFSPSHDDASSSSREYALYAPEGMKRRSRVFVRPSSVSSKLGVSSSIQQLRGVRHPLPQDSQLSYLGAPSRGSASIDQARFPVHPTRTSFTPKLKGVPNTEDGGQQIPSSGMQSSENGSSSIDQFRPGPAPSSRKQTNNRTSQASGGAEEGRPASSAALLSSANPSGSFKSRGESKLSGSSSQPRGPRPVRSVANSDAVDNSSVRSGMVAAARPARTF